MKTIKGPAIFLAQFMGQDAPFDTLANLAGWAKSLGYEGIQLPTDKRLIDLELAADSQTYCDEILGVLAEHGVALTELSTHLQGQLVAVHPAYDQLFDGFAAPEVRGNPQARREWAVGQVKAAAKASRRLGVGRFLAPGRSVWACSSSCSRVAASVFLRPSTRVSLSAHEVAGRTAHGRPLARR